MTFWVQVYILPAEQTRKKEKGKKHQIELFFFSFSF